MAQTGPLSPLVIHTVSADRSGGVAHWRRPFVPCPREAMSRRFVPLTEVSEILDISAAQAYALVRSGELPAIKVGGRGQWRVEITELDAYIERMYSQTRAFVEAQRED